ncbi:MAG TPA: alpha/beta fold hydrolase [Candidatus Dormibacteraeota bacterium]
MSATVQPIDGVWEGTLHVGATSLDMALLVSRGSDGVPSATVDVPAQGAKGLPVEALVFDGTGLRFEMKAFAGSFAGTRDATGARIAGTWTQAGTALPLVLTWRETATQLIRPQEPHPPFPYGSEDVSYENRAGGVTLAGTLTIPTGEGPFPAALLITGSGAQDRNEELFGHKPFLVLADWLTRAGIAVLRVDDRGVGGSSGDTRTATTEDLAGDVETGVGFLHERPKIDANRIGLIGHSEGGLIAPIVAARMASIAYIVLMAGPGLPGEDILLAQGELIARAEHTSEAQIAANADLQREIFAIVRSERDPQVAEPLLRAVVRDGLSKLARMAATDPSTVADTEHLVEAQVQAVNSPWFRFFLTYDPRPVLAKVRCPVLALDGDHDLQVPAEENLVAIRDAMHAGGNDRLTARMLPGLNHLFQTSTTGHPSEYGTIEETIAPAALDLIGSWIREQVGG